MMECNKEEAIRAKGIAESKMQNKDFPTALRIALKARQLCNDVENISQMLTVCEVHCAAQKTLLGNEMDWYGILQIEQTADEATIKKQYRKFALQLHPDKNKFPGAEAAFKLIGEAQRILLDKGKRSLHDVKRKASVSHPAPPNRSTQRATYTPNIGVPRNNFTGLYPQHQQPQNTATNQGYANGRRTFWTACPFCNVKYQYFIEVINKPLLCQTCKKNFTAYERSVQGAPAATNLNQPAFSQRTYVPAYGTVKVELGHQVHCNAEHSKAEFSQMKGCSSGFAPEKPNGKKHRKQESDSSESCDTESSSESEDEIPVDKDGEFKSVPDLGGYGESRRRSTRQKQQVSYKENLSDEEDFEHLPKKAKKNVSSPGNKEVSGNRLKVDMSETNKQSGFDADMKECNVVKHKECPEISKENKNVKGKEKVEENFCVESSEVHIDSSPDSSPSLDPQSFEYSDPDFYDFDKDRKEECFSAGQIWALYDTLDAMPRLYARIRKVLSPGFKLRITWLEPDPDDANDIDWVKNLPASCGKFRNGDLDNMNDCRMFSHVINWERGSQRDTYKIFPIKGEIWALFKNWDVKWKTEPNPNLKFQYEFVEILSEYTEGIGASVAYLGKVKGFASLFCRISKDGRTTFQISPNELFRFSHKVPSFKVTGHERDGIPKGSFELDSASLPKDLEEFVVAEDFVTVGGSPTSKGSCWRSSLGKMKQEVVSEASNYAHNADLKQAHLESEEEDVTIVENCSSSSSASKPEDIPVPDPEFFNFDNEKTIEKFQVGQIWLLYGDEDGLPRYYGLITKIDSVQEFKLQLRWLSSCPLPDNIIKWQDKAMPICCGRFTARTSQSYTCSEPFSHRLTVKAGRKKGEFIILPQKGEIWALYKNWSAEIRRSDLETCEYDMVEVLEENDLWIKVKYLERVNGYVAVFKAQVNRGLAFTMEIPRAELLRFSHNMPAFQLTEERGGCLRGFWELDPAALPVRYFAGN